VHFIAAKSVMWSRSSDCNFQNRSKINLIPKGVLQKKNNPGPATSGKTSNLRIKRNTNQIEGNVGAAPKTTFKTPSFQINPI
jgi:hypothetical protein